MNLNNLTEKNKGDSEKQNPLSSENNNLELGLLTARSPTIRNSPKRNSTINLKSKIQESSELDKKELKNKRVLYETKGIIIEEDML